MLRLSNSSPKVERIYPELIRAKPASISGVGQKTTEAAMKSPTSAAADVAVKKAVDLTGEMTGINRRNSIKSLYKLIENMEN